jgi:hypothetical protein
MKLRNLLFVLCFISTVTLGQNFYLDIGDAASTESNACASCYKSGGIATQVYDEWKNTLHAVAQDSFANIAGGYASGVYLYRLQVNNFTSVKKMVLIK